MRYRHFCKKCGLTWFDDKEISKDCDCPKKASGWCCEGKDNRHSDDCRFSDKNWKPVNTPPREQPA